MSLPQHNEELIFKAAIKIRPSAERVAFLRQACGADGDLLARLETLLRAHDEAGDFLETPPFASPGTPLSGAALDGRPIGRLAVPEGPGTVIGRYKLLEKIGEGGMAVVYMAEQQEPIRRKVALKIIKLGMDTRQVIARFEAERQALALMDHASIAKVLDAGATETGRPYFVMELVTGVSITEYCDKNSLSTKDRLTLFLQVCHAVQHAHQKGIIHRDIKPSNVMVTHHDGRPVPKVIDFGIAKATNQKLTEKTLFTRYAHIIGTPAYMSPEQAELSDLDIDTRSDIYSLGVLLYELLTGTTPFSEEELRKAGYIEMQRVIREQEPVKPSTKLSTLGETLTDIAKRRSSTPDLLRKSVRGDLDWIVMKSLEKDRIRRYETASSLAEDIRRHLESAPVLARGPGTAYRLERFLRRHRAQALAVLAMIVIASAGIAVLSLGRQGRRQRAEAEGFRHRDILFQAREQYAKADREAALETIRPILKSRHIGPEAQLLQAGILVEDRRSDEAVVLLQGLLRERREIAGAAHSLLARILWESEAVDAAKLKEIEEHRRQAEAWLPETAEAYFLRAMTALTVKEQLTALDRALRLEPGHYEARRLRAFTYYASRKYERMNEDASVMEALRDRDPLGYSLRAMALRELKRYPEAIAEYDSALALTPRDSPPYLDLAVQRCETFLRMGDYARVISEAQECLKLSPDKPVSHYYRFCALTALGDYDGAATLFHQIVRSDRKSRVRFENWCAKYVFDALAAGRPWHPANREPAGAAFLPMVEADETYHRLSANTRRLTTEGFTAQWAPDGKKLAFSLGVHGYSGVALFDPATSETDLLIVPGKDPAWSPDGKYIAFSRDCQALRLEAFATAERRDQYRPIVGEEVWVMNADGTQPRRLARGSFPSWGPDSQHIYYQASENATFCSVSLAGQGAEPKRITSYPMFSPSLSPDGRQVAYLARLEGKLLKAMDLTSQVVVAEQYGPFPIWERAFWSPIGRELLLGSSDPVTGLWIYDLDSQCLSGVLNGRTRSACLSADGTKLTFVLGPPFYEIWTADLDPNVSLVDALGPAHTMDEHLKRLVTLWTRRIAADPAVASNYASRAQHYQSLHEEAEARADLRRYWAALHPGWPPRIRLAGPWALMHAINAPFDHQFVVFVERQEDGLMLLRIAFGPKRGGEMKLSEVPMVAMSVVGLCFFPALDTLPVGADFTFGARVPVGPAVNSRHGDSVPIISRDSLELYFASNRPGGEGDWDIWVSQRGRMADPWGPPRNLGPGINSATDEYPTSVSSDGLTLYLFAFAEDTYDLYTVTRQTRDAPWGPRVNLGPIVNLPGGGRIGGPGTDWGGTISPDDLELFFTSWRSGTRSGLDIYVTTRATPADPWGEPLNLGPAVNTSGHEFPLAISPDGLVLFIGTSSRPGGLGSDDTWMIRRAHKGAAWSEPVNLGPSFNTSRGEILCSISPDGQWAYIGEYEDEPFGDLWMASINPPLISTSMKE